MWLLINALFNYILLKPCNRDAGSCYLGDVFSYQQDFYILSPYKHKIQLIGNNSTKTFYFLLLRQSTTLIPEISHNIVIINLYEILTGGSNMCLKVQTSKEQDNQHGKRCHSNSPLTAAAYV